MNAWLYADDAGAVRRAQQLATDPELLAAMFARARELHGDPRVPPPEPVADIPLAPHVPENLTPSTPEIPSPS